MDNRTPCTDCVGYRKDSDYQLYAAAGEKSTGMYMTQDIASKVCTYQMGFDQSKEHDLPNMPIKTNFAYECCDECDKSESECRFLCSNAGRVF